MDKNKLSDEGLARLYHEATGQTLRERDKTLAFAFGRAVESAAASQSAEPVALTAPAQVTVSRFVTCETMAYLDKLRFAASEAIRTFEDAGDAMSWSPTIDAIERLKGLLGDEYPYHSDDAAVDNFAWAMRDKMEESREKGRSGWDKPFECSPYRLAEMLIEHVAKGDPVDVGNFAMMLFNRPDARGVLAQVWKSRATHSAATGAQGLTDERILVEWDSQWETIKGPVSIRKVVCSTVRAILAASPADQVEDATAAARDVLAERRRQVTAEGWTLEHDDWYGCGELASAAAAYALSGAGWDKGSVIDYWPWELTAFKAEFGRRSLIKAAALLLAEIERIDRAAIAEKEPK